MRRGLSSRAQFQLSSFSRVLSKSSVLILVYVPAGFFVSFVRAFNFLDGVGGLIKRLVGFVVELTFSFKGAMTWYCASQFSGYLNGLGCVIIARRGY